MAYTLAWATSPVPLIPDPADPNRPRSPDRREHFGTEAAALRRARELLPGSPWLDLRLYGPDGRLLANQSALADLLGPIDQHDGRDNRKDPGAFEREHEKDETP